MMTEANLVSMKWSPRGRRIILYMFPFPALLKLPYNGPSPPCPPSTYGDHVMDPSHWTEKQIYGHSDYYVLLNKLFVYLL